MSITVTSDNVVPLPMKKKAGRRADDKWSPQVMKLGYTQLPNLLLRAQGKLKITPMQFNVLVQVIEHWWEAERDPYPAKDTIARRMNKSPRQVQRYLTQLEDAGMIKRIARYAGRKAQINNAYSFEGLIKKLKALEPEFTKEAEQKRLRRKKSNYPPAEPGALELEPLKAAVIARAQSHIPDNGGLGLAFFLSLAFEGNNTSGLCTTIHVG